MSGRFGYWSLGGFGALVLLVLCTAAGAAGRLAAPAAAGHAPSSYHVTLITGDVVQVTVSRDDALRAATVDAASRGKGLPEPSFRIVRSHGDVYVFPTDAAQYVGSKLDRELFNVSKLVEQGLHDRAADSLPVIVDYKRGIGPAPPAMVKERTLASISAAAAEEPKSKAAAFGHAVAEQVRRDAGTGKAPDAGPAPAGGDLFAGIDRIWLDERVEATLEDSVPQIGAPTAWAAGFDGTGVRVAVLDTGVDATHPDLAGKVVAMQNFTPTPDVTDHFGHGTHVASIVAGTGAASSGLRKGVAPGATLVNGKVLDDGGFGLDSWVIAGMEWAARDQGADVVNMSLGGGPSDGTDPLSQAVNQLTATYGTLFAIAAGNFGGRSTVASPGAASAALTVGAVDKSDVLAGFSSRGPRVGDFAIKPDIAAPGVGINAARAAGTSLGEPLDDFYTRLSGTSMATPHVAGSAALLVQRHPAWTPEQLKAELVTTATPGPYSVYEQGGGRVNVARVFTQPEVVATPAPIDLGYFPWPHDGDQPVTKTVTYTNASDEALTLNLSLAVTNQDGIAPSAGMLVIEPKSVSLAPGESKDVQLTVDTTVGATGLYGGYLVAEDAGAGAVVRTPVGFHKESEMFNLTVDGIAKNGGPARTISWVEVVNAEDTTAFQQTLGLRNGPVTFRLPPGTYSVMGMLFSSDDSGLFALDAAVVGNPELQIAGDMTLTLDARQAPQVAVTADKPTEWEHFLIGTYRSGSQRGSWESLLLASPPIDRAYAAPTQQVTMGDFGFRAKPSLRAPELEVSIAPPNAMTLDARYAFGAPKVDGTKRLDLVYAGYGRVQDFEGVDVRGKAVLITRGPLPPVGNPITFAEKVANATARGAALVIIHNHSPGLLLIGLSNATIPVLSLSKTQGEQLRSLLQQGTKLTVVIKGVVVSPYIYDAMVAERGRIRDTHTLALSRSNTVTVAAEYRGHVPQWLAGEAHHAFPPWSSFSFEGVRNLTTPFSRTEYVSTGDSRWWHLAWGSMTNEHIFEDSQQDVIRRYPAAASRSDAWFAQPQRPGIVKTFEPGADDGQPIVRQDNTLTFFIPEFTDDQGRYGFQDGRTDTVAFRLFENDSLIASGSGAFGSVDVSGTPATYRAELDVSRSAPYWLQSTETHTKWTFASAPTAPGATESVPALVVDYDLGALDSLNRVLPGIRMIRLSVHRQQGASAAPVTGAQVWASYDDGATWSAVPVRSLSGGGFVAGVENPASLAGGYVSLRVRAADAGGSVVDQTIIRAYGVK